MKHTPIENSKFQSFLLVGYCSAPNLFFFCFRRKVSNPVFNILLLTVNFFLLSTFVHPVAYARGGGGGFGGQTPPLTVGKNYIPLFLDRLAFFHTEIVFFCAVSNCLYNLEKLSL